MNPPEFHDTLARWAVGRGINRNDAIIDLTAMPQLARVRQQHRDGATESRTFAALDALWRDVHRR